MRHTPSIRLLLAVAAMGCFEKTGPVLGPPANVPVPAAVVPAPSPAQVAWQTQEMAAFLHFGMNTFTNKEQGDGTDSPALFNPTAFDARQWISALRNAGVRDALLSVKHHEGFCLWPTKCTTYSVAASPFEGGQGDVVRQFVDAAREGNVRVAFGLSPLDRHDPSYGTPAYLSVFECQLTELLTNYGTVDEIWLWQAPGAPPLDWTTIRDLVHEIQPQTLIELAKRRKVALPSRTPEGLLETVFKRAYTNLPEYLKGFEFTVACLQDADALERVAYELCIDCRRENVFYVEVRFAPQLHVRGQFTVREVLKAVCRGLERARKEINAAPEVQQGRVPRFECGVIVCALRFFLPAFSEHYRAYFEALSSAPSTSIYGLASLELARAAVKAAEEDGLPVVGFDLAGQERGFPAKDHQAAYQFAHEHFLGKTVHAGEDYGPESIFQAINWVHCAPPVGLPPE